MKRFTKITALILAVILIFSVNVFAEEVNVKEQTSVANAVLTYADRYYHFGLDNKELLKNFIELYLEENPDGFEKVMDVIMESMDEYSQYFTKEEFDEFYNYVESSFAGIGAYLSREKEYIVITGVMENSPAKKASLQAGDKILSADGISLINEDTDFAVSKIRGEKGTIVNLKILRDGVGEFNVSLIRDEIKDQTVSSTVLDGNIGYIYISSFSSNTGTEFGEALKVFDDLSIKKLIVDVRFNSGGVTESALDCVSYLVPDKAKMLVVHSKDNEELYQNIYNHYKPRDLVVLTNSSSASAAEIFAVAIKDNKKGTIIGETTYGKGTMQSVIGLDQYGGIKVTVAEFVGPSGTIINKQGVVPDIKVLNREREVKEDDFLPFTFDKKYKIGDDSEQVLAIKQKLKVLKYFSGTMDNYYDEALSQAVKTFQEVNGLYPYGVADITTQTCINNLMDGATVTEDTQLEKAVEFLKGIK